MGSAGMTIAVERPLDTGERPVGPDGFVSSVPDDPLVTVR
jgi:hypothetical protein